MSRNESLFRVDVTFILHHQFISFNLRLQNYFLLHFDISYFSKAVGEPPLFLAASVFYAIKNAIRSARADAGVAEDFHLDSPATAERIRLGCEDKFLEQVPQLPAEGSFKPWGIQV